MSEFFTADEWSQSGNDVFTFVPNGATPTNTRQVVVTAACNQCHNPLNEHGGDRLLTQYCILCHQPQTVNPDTLNTMDMKVFIHKIHDASNLPSVKAGTPYQVYHRGAWENFSNIVFPQDVRNCTTCHTSAAAQNTAWKTNPSRAACGSCHDDVNFATGTNHVGLPQFDDTQCAYCHATPTAHDFDASIPGAHVVPNYSTSLPGLVVKVLGVTNTAAGSQPTISFSLFDKSGNPVDPTKITKFSAVLGGGNVDYGTGAAGIRVSETVTKVTGSAGTYSYTMTNKIPAGATGSYTIMLMATNNVTLLPGTVDSTAAVDNALPSIYYFSVDSSPVQARRVVVSTANCSACHSDLQFVHGGTRGNSQACGICHNPTLTDGTSKQSVNFAWQIHSIHRGSNLANPYILGTTNYQSILFPGDLRDCNTCHVGASYQVDNIGAKAPVVSTGGFTPTTLPTAAACQGCHDDIDTASHALANTTSLGESCVVCHGINGAFAVDTVHQRVQ
jgi:OmcA/MtrC family decaheme c-type cytochrome